MASSLFPGARKPEEQRFATPDWGSIIAQTQSGGDRKALHRHDKPRGLPKVWAFGPLPPQGKCGTEIKGSVQTDEFRT
jgi:hypothetical protein